MYTIGNVAGTLGHYSISAIICLAGVYTEWWFQRDNLEVNWTPLDKERIWGKLELGVGIPTLCMKHCLDGITTVAD